MIGLFGLLNLGAGSLVTERQAVEVTGQNLANVNNPAYARQRLAVTTAPTVDSPIGPEGTGAQATAIKQLRSSILDDQIQQELSVTGSLDAQQTTLGLAESALGQQLDRTDSSSDAAAAAANVGTTHSLGDSLSDLFNQFQSWSANPSSLTERQGVTAAAASLADQFNQVSGRLDALNTSLNSDLSNNVDSANTLLSQIADLNGQISRAELNVPGSANDLRDLRQSKLEDLSTLVKIDVSDGDYGAVNVSVSGNLMVTGNQVADGLSTYDPGNGKLLVEETGGNTPLALTGGKIEGTIQARDGAIADLRNGVDSLAKLLITQVNSIHAAGYGLNGSTNADFFTGSDAASIAVNPALANDPSLLQGAGTTGAAGDNKVALALAQLSEQVNPGLNNQTFSENYTGLATAFGQDMSSVNSQMSDQQAVQDMLTQQRDSVSGVSVDEEMTNLTTFQRAFQASARLLTVVDTLLQTVIDMHS